MNQITKEQQRRLWLLRNDLIGHEKLVLDILRPAYPDTARVVEAILNELDHIEYPKETEKIEGGVLSPFYQPPGGNQP